MPTVAPLTGQDLREHKMLARIEHLEFEVAELEKLCVRLAEQRKPVSKKVH